MTETPEQMDARRWYAVTDGSWEWDAGEEPPFITLADSSRSAVEAAIRAWFENGETFDSADLKVATLDTCASAWVDVDEDRNWRLERWWDHPPSDAEAGMVMVPIAYLESAFSVAENAPGGWGQSEAAKGIREILRQAQEPDHE